MFRQLGACARNEFQVLVFREALSWDERTTRNHGIENHYTTTKFLNMPSVFRLVWIEGYKFDFCRVSMKADVVALFNLFPRSILQHQSVHKITPKIQGQ